MKILLTFLFMLIANPCFAVDTRTYTVCESGGGCDYTTLQAAETALQQDLVANDSALTIEIQNTWASPDGGTTVDGWTTDATRFLTITAVGAARASATLSTTSYRAEGSGTTVISLLEDYTVVDGIQAEATGTSTNIFSSTFFTGIVFKNCFVSGGGLSTTTGILFSVSAGTGKVARNNVIIDCTGIGINGLAANGGIRADNNTIENCGTGIATGADDIIARNNILWNCTTPLTGDFAELSQENFTDAGSLSYGTCSDCGTGDQVSQSDPFEDLTGEDYSLASGSAPIDAGQDLSGDFTDAIGGKTRDANFDKGADEFIAAGGNRVLIRTGIMFWLFGL